jgi:hypothetical protein
MEPDGSLPLSKGPATYPYPGPDLTTRAVACRSFRTETDYMDN